MCEDPTTISGNPSDESCPFKIAAGATDGTASSGTGDPASFGSQISNLETWARESGCFLQENLLDSLTLVSDSTSEHKVYYRESDVRAVKKTVAGFYGQIPCPEDGKLGRRNATPAEYLKRMALHNAVFSSDFRLEGVMVSDKPSMILFQPAGEPSIVISQPWYVKDGIVSNEDIHDFLTAEGFRASLSGYFGWYRAEDGVVLVDAKADNFIRTTAGVVALDLQLAIFSREELGAAGLPTTSELAGLFIPRQFA